MGTITTSSNTVTMSSREVAALTGKQHKDVIRDVRAMRKALEKDGADLRHLREYLDERGYTSEFRLDRLLTETLLTGYSIALRYRVVTRLGELENVSRQAVTVPQTLPEALRLAADQAEQNQQLQQVITEQAPKVRALAVLADTTGSICITDAAKHIGMAPQKLFSWLSLHRWIYRRASHSAWSAFQPRLSSGLLEHKLVIINRPDAADDVKVVERVLVTRRGLTCLAEQINGASL